MNNCNCIEQYEKCNLEENIVVGDIISIIPTTDKVVRSNTYDNNVIGICCAIEGDLVSVQNQGTIDIQTIGIVCIGDKLTISESSGVARAIKYIPEDEHIFGIRCVGKCIDLYKTYNKAKLLIDIE